MGLGRALVTSFSFNHFLKDPNSKYSHILKCWGSGLRHMNLGNTDLPVTACLSSVLGNVVDTPVISPHLQC